MEENQVKDSMLADADTNYFLNQIHIWLSCLVAVLYFYLKQKMYCDINAAVSMQ